MAVLLMTMPGKSCESIGTRIGISLRKITGVSIEGLVTPHRIKMAAVEGLHKILNGDDNDEPEERFDESVCNKFCKRIPWYPDYVVEDSCPDRCMLMNPNWRRDHTDDYNIHFDDDFNNDGGL